MRVKIQMMGFGIILILATIFVWEKLDLDFPPVAAARGLPCIQFVELEPVKLVTPMNGKYSQGYRVVGFSTFVGEGGMSEFVVVMCKP